MGYTLNDLCRLDNDLANALLSMRSALRTVDRILRILDDSHIDDQQAELRWPKMEFLYGELSVAIKDIEAAAKPFRSTFDDAAKGLDHLSDLADGASY